MDTTAHVTQVFAELTRYPLEILTSDADFEADLGIDSVKRVEILGRLQRHYGISNGTPIRVRDFRTIASVVRFIEGARGEGATTNGAREEPAPAEPIAAAAVERPQPRASAEPAWTNGLAWAEAAPNAPTPASHPSSVTKPHTNGHGSSNAHGQSNGHVAPATTLSPELERTLLDAFRSVVSDVLLRSNGHARPASERRMTFSRADFEGRVVLVTGAGRGLGRVVARRLGALGARVIVNSFHSRERGESTTVEIRAEGGDATHLWGSVANSEHLKKIFGDIDRQFGGLDMLVSNASNGYLGPVSGLTPSDFMLSFQTNVIGLHQASLLAAPLMERRGGGHIVAMSSPGADRYVEHFGCQGPVKAALQSLARYLAVELGPRNIQVNVISAGALEGDLLRKYPDADRLIPYWTSKSVTGRLTDEEGIADHVLFLLTAPNINGATIVVDDTGTIRV